MSSAPEVAAHPWGDARLVLDAEVKRAVHEQQSNVRVDCADAETAARRHRLMVRVQAAVYRAVKAGREPVDSDVWRALPYSLRQLRQHLQRLWAPRMTWGNYGAWHIDHIEPQAAFTFVGLDDDAFQRCWALENLRPLWGRDNRVKGNRRGT